MVQGFWKEEESSFAALGNRAAPEKSGSKRANEMNILNAPRNIK
jgi:hypothetical protein